MTPGAPNGNMSDLPGSLPGLHAELQPVEYFLRLSVLRWSFHSETINLTVGLGQSPASDSAG